MPMQQGGCLLVWESRYFVLDWFPSRALVDNLNSRVNISHVFFLVSLQIRSQHHLTIHIRHLFQSLCHFLQEDRVVIDLMFWDVKANGLGYVQNVLS